GLSRDAYDNQVGAGDVVGRIRTGIVFRKQIGERGGAGGGAIEREGERLGRTGVAVAVARDELQHMRTIVQRSAAQQRELRQREDKLAGGERRGHVARQSAV